MGCESFLELGAWQGSPAKLPLTSGDGEQHSFIATASSLTAVWLHPTGWTLGGKSSSELPLDPALRVMLLGLLSSYLSQHSQTHIHNVLRVMGAEGRLGKHCPKCISAGRLCLIVLVCDLFERTLVFFQEYIHMLVLLLARFWSSTSEARLYYYYYYYYYFPGNSLFACPMGQGLVIPCHTWEMQ